MPSPAMTHRLAAEFLGTFCLVLTGCGTAVLAAGFLDPDGVHLGVGFVGVALAFGLSVLAMAYAVGHVSGGHFNPAVTLGLAAGRRFPWRDVPAYAAVQVVGATTAAGVLFVVASGRPGFDAVDSGFATNGYGPRSPGGVAPIAIGFGLTLIHLVSIPVTNTSVNPARSIGPALFAGAPALGQLWLFVLAPLLGAVVAGVSSTALFGSARPAVAPAAPA